jgi:hypothetical protein
MKAQLAVLKAKLTVVEIAAPMIGQHNEKITQEFNL